MKGIDHVLHARATCIISCRRHCGYCWRNQGCRGFAGDYWGSKNRALYAEVKVPSAERMIRSPTPHTHTYGRAGLRDTRGLADLITRPARAKHPSVRPASTDNHYHYYMARARSFVCGCVWFFFPSFCFGVWLCVRGCASRACVRSEDTVYRDQRFPNCLENINSKIILKHILFLQKFWKFDISEKKFSRKYKLLINYRRVENSDYYKGSWTLLLRVLTLL